MSVEQTSKSVVGVTVGWDGQDNRNVGGLRTRDETSLNRPNRQLEKYLRHTRTEIAKQEAEESIEELNGIEVGGHSSQPHTLSEFCLNMTLGQAGRESDKV